jgi:hypothetical protein
MLLDYDRVFSAMGVPACLWRRTGEIYKANREFTELIGVEGYMMRDGRLCIYELMAEESAVNYWEVRRSSVPSAWTPLFKQFSSYRNTVMLPSIRAKRPSLHLVFCDLNPCLTLAR